MITAVHVDDDDSVLRAVSRILRVKRPDWELHSFDGCELEPVVTAIRDAAMRGHQVVYISDRELKQPFGAGEAFWRELWAKLSADERRAIKMFVALCTETGFRALLDAVAITEDFTGTMVTLPKPVTAQALLAPLPP